MISSTTNRVSYQGDGTSASFAFQYEFHSPSDLNVYIWNSARTVATVSQVLTTNYTISGTTDAQNRYKTGGTVIFNSTPATGDHIVIVRNPSITSAFGLKFNQTIPNEELTKALDRLTILEQRLGEYLGRGVRIADSFPMTFDATLPDRLPKNAPLIVNSSGLAMGIGVVAFDGTTAATYFGILPVNNGGTGLDFSVTKGMIYSPGNNSTFQAVTDAAQGWVLTANASSAPTFQALSATIINSGILQTQFGGTGNENAYNAQGVIYASSATSFASTPTPGADQVLVATNTGAYKPQWGQVNLASNSSVTNILSQANGGTGTASSFAKFALIYQSDTNVYGGVNTGSAGQVLTANSGAVATFQTPVAASTVAYRPVLFNSGLLTAQTSDNTLILSGSSFTLSLPSVASNDGKIFEIIHDGSSLVQSYIISSQTSQTIGNVAAPNYALYTYGEKLKIMGSAALNKWLILNHDAKTDPVNAGAIVITATSAPTKGTTQQVDNFWWSRQGNLAVCRYEFLQTSGAGGAAGTGDYIFVMPNGLLIDTRYISIYQTGEGAGAYITNNCVGNGSVTDATQSSTGFVTVYNSTSFRIFGVSPTTPFAVGSGAIALNAQANYVVTFNVPIAGWQP